MDRQPPVPILLVERGDIDALEVRAKAAATLLNLSHHLAMLGIVLPLVDQAADAIVGHVILLAPIYGRGNILHDIVVIIVSAIVGHDMVDAIIATRCGTDI
jgi:hypothetical protein